MDNNQRKLVAAIGDLSYAISSIDSAIELIDMAKPQGAKEQLTNTVVRLSYGISDDYMIQTANVVSAMKAIADQVEVMFDNEENISNRNMAHLNMLYHQYKNIKTGKISDVKHGPQGQSDFNVPEVKTEGSSE